MKHLLQTLLIGAILSLILDGCVKQPETIVINEDPESPAAKQTAEDTAATQSTETADFRQLVIGEIHSISTLDPLFADNNSIRRTVQLLYEGLVRFDRNGKVIPAISKRWSVSDDSLTYRFTLRNNVFFHDSNIFSSGVGRKVVAPDFRYAFERMAKINVPDDAAKLFMSIRGFEPYFNEQHHVLNPAHRELRGISGIVTPNDSTLIISLIEKDRRLLQKLASPYAVVYPREAVRESPEQFTPVGSGPFQLSQRRGDSTYIFSQNKEHWNAQNGSPNLDRVDVVVERNEPQLFRSIASRNIHLIPEMGPRILQNVMISSSQLQPAYKESYALTIAGGGTTYSLHYNPGADEPEEAVRSLFSSLDFSQLVTEGLPAGLVTVTSDGPDSDRAAGSDTSASTSAPSLSTPLYSTYSEDPFQQWMVTRISSRLEGERPLQMLRIRTPSRQTALYTRSFVPMYEGQTPDGDGVPLLQYSAKHVVFAIREIENLEFNRYPWWINLRQVDLPGVDQL